MFGDSADGASFLTESLRSSSKGDDSPKVTKSTGGGLFTDKEEIPEDNEIFSSSGSK